jgi:hypothetical protein
MRDRETTTGHWSDMDKTRRRMDPKLRQRVEGCRRIATEHRKLAENEYAQTLALASRWELYANLLEQGYSDDEADRRAFGGKLADLRAKRRARKELASANA